MTRKLTFRQYFFAAAITLAAFSLLNGQTLVKSELNGTLTSSEMNALIAKAFPDGSVSQTTSIVELHKVTYTSVDVNNKRVNLTGLVAVPVGGAPKGLVVYCHGTTVDRGRSPSKYKGKGEAPETVEAIAAFAGGGYAVVLPDYLGLGDHKGAHPYPFAKINAASGRDIISAARSFAKQKNYTIGRELFITGYSEGGAVAMALTQLLQSYVVPIVQTPVNPDYQVTKSAPLSGPYDLSGVTRNFILTETNEQVGFVLRLYLMSYVTTFMNKEKGIKLNTFYKPALANALGLNYRLNPTDDGLIKNIGITTMLMRADNRLSNVLQPAFYKQIKEGNSSNIVVRMFKENDVYNWSPRVPMLMVYVDKDFVVSPENTTKTYETMRRRGVSTAALKTIMLPDTLNHITGIAPALSKTRAFFDGGFAAVPEAK